MLNTFVHDGGGISNNALPMLLRFAWFKQLSRSFRLEMVGGFSFPSSLSFFTWCVAAHIHAHPSLLFPITLPASLPSSPLHLNLPPSTSPYLPISFLFLLLGYLRSFSFHLLTHPSYPLPFTSPSRFLFPHTSPPSDLLLPHILAKPMQTTDKHPTPPIPPPTL
jgi:hypothetical protein